MLNSFIPYISIAPLQVHYSPWQQCILSMLHSFIPDISIAPLQVHCFSEALPTTALRLCRSYQATALHATVSLGLAQSPYMVARVGCQSATLRTQGTERIADPPCPTT